MSDDDAPPAMEVRDARVTFGGVVALDGVSLSIHRGLLYGLAGPNGSGKSTLLAAMSRHRPLTSGAISLMGADCGHSPPEALAKIGLARTFQAVRLVPGLTVLENVMLGADVSIFGSSVAAQVLRPWRSHESEVQSRSRAAEVIERVSLTPFISDDPLTLPYGRQRRVEIARALASNPKLLLLDEPTAGMNHDERDEICTLLLSLRNEGLTQIVVEHDVEMLVSVCDHLFVLDSGHLIASGPPRVCISQPEVQEAYFGVITNAGP